MNAGQGLSYHILLWSFGIKNGLEFFKMQKPAIFKCASITDRCLPRCDFHFIFSENSVCLGLRSGQKNGKIV